ncbi:hypothetical protein BDZ88DRAFT_438859 [Geranomyces variabilis]|nr:hypothetical protein BDZ88DRAFT_438859 [Geranomyces variabilis]
MPRAPALATKIASTAPAELALGDAPAGPALLPALAVQETAVPTVMASQGSLRPDIAVQRYPSLPRRTGLPRQCFASRAPGAALVGPGTLASARYTVKTGDACWANAKAAGITTDHLSLFNPGLNCALIMPGEVLCLSSGNLPAVPTTSISTTPAQPTSTPRSGGGVGRKFKVGSALLRAGRTGGITLVVCGLGGLTPSFHGPSPAGHTAANVHQATKYANSEQANCRSKVCHGAWYRGPSTWRESCRQRQEGSEKGREQRRRWEGGQSQYQVAADIDEVVVIETPAPAVLGEVKDDKQEQDDAGGNEGAPCGRRRGGHLLSQLRGLQIRESDCESQAIKHNFRNAHGDTEKCSQWLAHCNTQDLSGYLLGVFGLCVLGALIKDRCFVPRWQKGNRAANVQQQVQGLDDSEHLPPYVAPPPPPVSAAGGNHHFQLPAIGKGVPEAPKRRVRSDKSAAR